ncbi:hypothetical protein [Streptomyces sp. NPDC050564]|uniref:hypothetical protein n=1 Tax=Streptomyces sp. NPDC050564 TaxID=3365631 RepID=UPI0037A6FF02
MGRRILHLRFGLPADYDAELPERLRRLLEDITPRVQMIEPDMAVLDLTGAIPYWKRDARGLTELVQLRALAHFGLPSSAGCTGNRIRQVRRYQMLQDDEPDCQSRLKPRIPGRLERPQPARPTCGRSKAALPWVSDPDGDAAP